MMTTEDNDLLCRVEGDAPMGQMMRRHWIPALLIEEVSEPDGEPVPVRLFGEDLVAWRDSEGRVGLTERYCPHRGPSLEFARNENGGLRCLYHGWKMNVHGDVVEMPSEPADSGFLHKVKVKAYPTHEHGGFVWAYMGPAGTQPAFEAPAFAPQADSKVAILKIKVDCNWAQVLEGAIDSAHSSSLHSSDVVPGNAAQGTQPRGTGQATKFLRPSTDKNPRIVVQATDYGFKYAALRRPITQADINDYVRMTLFVAPFHVLVPSNNQFNITNVNVPIDDTHTMWHFVAHGGIEQEEYRRMTSTRIGVDVDERFEKLRKTRQNKYLQDRKAMKLGNFTGIEGIPFQDIAMWETMRPIADRTRERLGASDQAIVHFRRQLVEAARSFRAGAPALGTAPACNTVKATLKPFEGMLPKGAEWRHLDNVAAQAERERELAAR